MLKFWPLPDSTVSLFPQDDMIYRVLADILLAVHAVFVTFVICGLVVVIFGACFHWHWIRRFWFRIFHLIAILIVVLQAWLGMTCPLTTWEMQLRQLAGDATYQGGFVAHWVRELLFHEAPDWVFILCYTLFGAAVLGSWLLAPPRVPWRRSPGPAS